MAIIRYMRLFQRLKALREFEKAHLPFLKTIEDFDIVCEIGVRQESGNRITMKELFLADIGAVSTVQRRLSRLRKLGAIEQFSHNGDGRVIELLLSAEVGALYKRYAALLAE